MKDTIIVPGIVADNIGAIALQAIADMSCTPVLVPGASYYHAGKTFSPGSEQANGTSRALHDALLKAAKKAKS